MVRISDARYISEIESIEDCIVLPAQARRKMKMPHWTGPFAALVVAALMPLTSMAQCAAPPTDEGTVVYRFRGYTPTAFDPSRFLDGAVIYTSAVSASSLSAPTSCNDDDTSAGTAQRTVGTLAPYDAYPPNIPGVGLRFRVGDSARQQTYAPWSYEDRGLVFHGVDPRSTVTMELVKIGHIEQGGVLQGEVRNNGRFNYAAVVLSGDILVYPVMPTCAPVDRSLSLPLGQVTADGAARRMNVSLRCAGAPEKGMRNVSVTLVDQGRPGNRSNWLMLAADSTASGVGVQVLCGNFVMGMGQAAQQIIHPLGRGVFEIPLEARFVQTAASVKAGSALAVAVLTMTYP